MRLTPIAAMQLLIEGKKIREIDMPAGGYVYFNPEDGFLDEEGQPDNLAFGPSYEWFLYEEPQSDLRWEKVAEALDSILIAFNNLIPIAFNNFISTEQTELFKLKSVRDAILEIKKHN